MRKSAISNGCRMNRKYAGKFLVYLASFNSWLKDENYLMRWRYIIPASIALWLYFFLGNSLKGVFVVGVLAVAGSYSTIYKRSIRIPSAVELVTLGTVVTSISYGPFAGAVFGIIVTLASEIISSAVDVFTFLYMFARGVIGVAAFYMASTNIVLLGVLMVLLFNAICQPIYLLPGDIETKMKGLYFFVINIIFNFIAFFLLGGFLLKIAV
ncbi:hypothetical protein J4470_01185 [Candidatus Woesearchaeota archaeon]|nr:hypothetical protein [Candidatus Woesearchaeota archaeon]